MKRITKYSILAVSGLCLALISLMYFGHTHLAPNNDSIVSEQIVTQTQQYKIHSQELSIRNKLDQHQAQSNEHISRYLDNGWIEVNPATLSDSERKAIEFDPSLVGLQDDLLFRQLQTNSLHEDQMDNAVEIFTLTNHNPLRRELIRSLGRLNNAKANDALIRIFNQQTLSKEERRLLLGSILPHSIGDDTSQFLIKQLDNMELSQGEKTQICATLIAKVLADKPDYLKQDELNELPSELLTAVHPQWHDLLKETYTSVFQSPLSKN